MDHEPIADRLAIHELSDRYADAADRRDAVAFAGLFLPDATLTVVRGGDTSVYEGRDQIATIPGRLDRYRLTLHVVTNHHCRIDGDTAHGGALCQAHPLTDDEPLDEPPEAPIDTPPGRPGDRPGAGSTPTATDRVLTIRYVDTYARAAPGWQFASREVHTLWTSIGPVTVPSPSPS
jgi:uncharacterized protein (TIGR02246 family)